MMKYITGIVAQHTPQQLCGTATRAEQKPAYCSSRRAAQTGILHDELWLFLNDSLKSGSSYILYFNLSATPCTDCTLTTIVTTYDTLSILGRIPIFAEISMDVEFSTERNPYFT